MAATLKYGGYNEDMLVALRELAAREVQAVAMLAPYPCRLRRQPMRRETVAGIVIDTCRDHGVWFDHKELLEVLQRTLRSGIAFGASTEDERAWWEALNYVMR